MAIAAKAKQTLQSELARLERERKQLDKEIDSLRKSISAIGGSVATSARSTAKRATGKRGRPKSTKLSPSAEKALKLIKSNPGITGAELAKKMGMSKNPTGIYPVVKRLQAVGKVKKQGKGFKAA